MRRPASNLTILVKPILADAGWHRPKESAARPLELEGRTFMDMQALSREALMGDEKFHPKETSKKLKRLPEREQRVGHRSILATCDVWLKVWLIEPSRSRGLCSWSNSLNWSGKFGKRKERRIKIARLEKERRREFDRRMEKEEGEKDRNAPIERKNMQQEFLLKKMQLKHIRKPVSRVPSLFFGFRNQFVVGSQIYSNTVSRMEEQVWLHFFTGLRPYLVVKQLTRIAETKQALSHCCQNSFWLFRWVPHANRVAIFPKPYFTFGRHRVISLLKSVSAWVSLHPLKGIWISLLMLYPLSLYQQNCRPHVWFKRFSLHHRSLFPCMRQWCLHPAHGPDILTINPSEATILCNFMT